MDRRSLLNTLSPLRGEAQSARRSQAVPASASGLAASGDRISTADLTPYVPRTDKPWDELRAAHFLRRIGFGVSRHRLDAALASTPQALLDEQLADHPVNPGNYSWATGDPLPPDTDPIAAAETYGTWTYDMRGWWIETMLNATTMLREKMTLFWHGHFTTGASKVLVTQYLYRQNQMYRRFAFGNVKDLATEVTTDPAMLIFLDGATNKAGKPNENYARELMELFLLGIGKYADGTPHYTEHDIVELARALTGWQMEGQIGVFHSDEFDSGSKTIFGESGNFGVPGNAPLDAIDLLFRQNDPDYGRKRVAIHVCTKLYKFFVCDIPDMTIVAAMAQTLEQNNWKIGPVLRELLASEHFFDDNFIGAKVKSPVDFVVGAMSEFGLAMNYNFDPGEPPMQDPITVMNNLSQVLFQPPNVAGWSGGKNWISTATLPSRVRYAQLWLQPVPVSLNYGFDAIGYINQFSHPDDVHNVLDRLIATLLPMPISASAKDALLQVLLGGAPDYEWKLINSDQRVRSCLVRLTALGQYQLL